MSLRNWLEGKEFVHTVQVNQTTGRVWDAGVRRVDTSRTTYVRFDGSRRDYAGLQVIDSSPDQITVLDKSMNVRITYTHKEDAQH